MSNQSVTIAQFDSVFMNMVASFNELLSIAAKAETDSALTLILEALDSMYTQTDSAIESHVDSTTITIDDIDAALADVVSTTPIDSTNPIDSDIDSSVDTRKPFDSDAVIYIKKQLTRINIITNKIADNADDMKRMDKKTKLAFIEEANNHYEMLLKFVTDNYIDSDLLETANLTSYIQTKQNLLITCYENVSIS